MGNDILNELDEFDKMYDFYTKVSKDFESNILYFMHGLSDFLTLIKKYKTTIFVNKVIELILNYIIVNIDYVNSPSMKPVRKNLLQNILNIYLNNDKPNNDIENMFIKLTDIYETFN
jgi:hypothetical protein